MSNPQKVYAVGNKEYGSKSEALAEITRLCGVNLSGADWTDITTIQDAVNGRQIYRLLAKFEPLTPNDTQGVFMNEDPLQVIMGDDDHTRELALRFALMQYANEPCRICGKMITEDDVMPDGPGLFFVGYSEDNTGRAAHGRCWQGFLSVLRQANVKGYLQQLIVTGHGKADEPPPARA